MRTSVSFAVAVLLLVVGCGGGGGGNDNGNNSSNTPPPPASPPAVQSGVFKDANVEGLSYRSGAQNGVTDTAGRYTCETGTDVAFAIGRIDLGSAPCGPLLTPAHLVPGGALDAPTTRNLARFLQMLDIDGDPTNGITISPDLRTVADNWQTIDFSKLDIGQDLVDIIADAILTDQTLHELPSVADAEAHLRRTVECAYSGAFAGRTSGGQVGGIAVIVGASPFFQEIAPSVIDWRAVDDDEFFIGGGGGGSVMYSAAPVIDHSGPNLAGPISAVFETPDHLSGTWSSAGRSGSFSAERLGGASGEYRLIGDFNGSEAFGALGLSIDGNAVSGEAFDAIERQTFTVGGTVIGDSATITATGGGETIDATLTFNRDLNGELVGFGGTWEDGTLAGGICRLN